jgi:hypothetical protein
VEHEAVYASPETPAGAAMLEDAGIHNSDLESSRSRLIAGATYRDCSTVVVVPTRGMISARVVLSWMQLMSPMNQKFARLPPTIMGRGMEVGDAYNQTIVAILKDPVLSRFKFVLTLEEDNLPPPDGLLKLLAAMHEGPWAAIGGLYWTKGEGGQPMIYGDPKEWPLTFVPQLPKPETVQECRGLGMGFTLFDMNLFRDPNLPYPWFRTLQENGHQYTQDLYFFENAVRRGYRFACHTGVKVGHLDVENDVVW